MNVNDKIKEWYCSEYPTDDLGSELNGSVSWYDLFYCLDRRHNVYEFLGVDDSLVRERIFEKLAEIMEVDYNYIYEQWLLSA